MNNHLRLRATALSLLPLLTIFTLLGVSKSKASPEVPASVAPAQEAKTVPTLADKQNLPRTNKPRAFGIFWDKLAWCETNGDWQNGGKFAGGLGIYQGTWENWGGKEFAPTPDKATKEEQIIVAQRVSTLGYSATITRDPEWARIHGVPTTYLHKKDPVGFNGWGALRCAGGRPNTYYYNPALILDMPYSFNEKSVMVGDLQKYLRITSDGHYGMKTRAAHLAYLKKHNIHTANVPMLPSYLKGVPSDKSKRCSKWEPKFRFYGLPVEQFSYIAWRESRCNEKIVSKPNANGSRDYGLVQINSSWKAVTSDVCKSKYGDMTALLNVNCNLKVAKYLMDNTDDGIKNWSTSSGKG